MAHMPSWMFSTLITFATTPMRKVGMLTKYVLLYSITHHTLTWDFDVLVPAQHDVSSDPSPFCLSPLTPPSLYACRHLLSAISPLIGAEFALGGKAVGPNWAQGASDEIMGEWKQKALDAVKEEMEVLIQETCSVEYGKLMRKVCIPLNIVKPRSSIDHGWNCSASHSGELINQTRPRSYSLSSTFWRSTNSIFMAHSVGYRFSVHLSSKVVNPPIPTIPSWTGSSQAFWHFPRRQRRWTTGKRQKTF